MASAAADQLAVDAAGVVHFGADDVQPAQFGDARAEFDVGAAAGHVRRDGDFARQARLGDDLGFGLDVVRVEDLMFEAAGVEQFRQQFRFVDRARADQDRPPLGVQLDRPPRRPPPTWRRPCRKPRSGSRWRMAGRFVGIGSTWQR